MDALSAIHHNDNENGAEEVPYGTVGSRGGYCYVRMHGAVPPESRRNYWSLYYPGLAIIAQCCVVSPAVHVIKLVAGVRF